MLWIAGIASFLLSIFAKYAADAYLVSRIPLVGSFIGLRYVENPGVAFSVRFPGHLQTFLIAAAFILILWASQHAKTTASRIAFGMILGGAAGNIADRLGDGMVTDYVQFGTFPVFNLPDSFITIGVFLLVIEAAAKRWRRS